MYTLRYNLILLFCCLVLLSACSSYSPPEKVSLEFRSRAEQQTKGGVRVSAAVLSAEESKAAFATPMADKGIQPVWLEVENSENQGFVLMILSIDRDYFSPSEAAWRTRSLGEGGTVEKIRFFDSQHIPIIIPPNTTRSGFVYTNLDPGAKAFAVELIGDREQRHFEFILPVPGLEVDFQRIDFDALYAPEEIRDLDLDALRDYLESLPCCVLGGDRETPGDPLNLVVVGEGRHLLATFVRQGWDLTETVRAGSAWRTVISSVFGSRYRTSPVSPLYVFDRPQDAALQKARGTVDERNHLRLWLTPVTFVGTPVWVGQISRDIGVKLSSKTFVTHKIDPMVDEARLYVLLDLASSQYLARIGFTQGVGFALPEAPRFNYTEDPYYTDGLRAVLFLSKQARTYHEIEWLDWAIPTGGLDQPNEGRVTDALTVPVER